MMHRVLLRNGIYQPGTIMCVFETEHGPRRIIDFPDPDCPWVPKGTPAPCNILRLQSLEGMTVEEVNEIDNSPLLVYEPDVNPS